MKEYMQDHPKATSVAVIAIAVFVVVLLYVLSTQPPRPRSASQPVIAHGTQGPVVASGGEQETQSGQEPQSDQPVRQVDFQLELSDEISDGVSLEKVLYVDIDANGTEEALTVLRSGGEAGRMSWRLYGMSGGQTQILYERVDVAAGDIQIDGPRLVETEGVFAEADEPCCPSTVKRTFYVWKADGLVVTKVEASAPSA